MKKSVVIAGVLAVVGGAFLAGCLDTGGGSGAYKGPLIRYHFAGRTAIGKDGQAMVLKRVDALPETAAVRTHFARRLGAAAAQIWHNDLPAGVEPQPELMRPLIEDLLTAESLVEVHGPVGRSETLVAVELTEERARLWDTNLVQLARAWKLGAPAPATLEGIKGWTIRRPQAPGLQVFRAGKWTLVGIGSDRIPALSSALQTTARSGRPMVAASGILDVQLDLPKLGAWFPVLAQFPLAPVQLTTVGRGDNVRTEVRLMYSGRIPWKPEPWQIPTNIVSEPLTSFTVAQGVRPFLEKFEGLGALGVPMPNQYCAWGAFHQYGHTFFAVPQSGASNTLARIYPRFAQAMAHYFDSPIGQFLYVTNRGDISWGGGLPGISPILSHTKAAGQEFVYARMFPLMPNRTLPPADLFAQFQGRNDLLYYDWELSSNRIDVARQLFSLGNIFNKRPPPSNESPSQKWLRAVGPLLGNAITEVSLRSPQELLLVRKSQIGLTGFELASLSAWLESPGFPSAIARQPAIKLDELRRKNAKPAPAPGPGTGPTAVPKTKP